MLDRPRDHLFLGSWQFVGSFPLEIDWSLLLIAAKQTNFGKSEFSIADML
jgi:hypothetical protein